MGRLAAHSRRTPASPLGRRRSSSGAPRRSGRAPQKIRPRRSDRRSDRGWHPLGEKIRPARRSDRGWHPLGEKIRPRREDPTEVGTHLVPSSIASCGPLRPSLHRIGRWLAARRRFWRTQTPDEGLRFPFPSRHSGARRTGACPTVRQARKTGSWNRVRAADGSGRRGEHASTRFRAGRPRCGRLPSTSRAPGRTRR